MATTTYTHDNDTVIIKTDVGSGTLTGRANIVFQGADNSETGRLGNKNTTDDNMTLKADKSELVLESENEKITLSPGANKLVKIDVDAQTYANQCLNGDGDTIPNKRYVENMTIGTGTDFAVKKSGDTMTGNLSIEHNSWPQLRVESTGGSDASISLKSQNGRDWTLRNDDSESNRLEIRITNGQRAYLQEGVSGSSRWGNLYQTGGETRLGTYLPGANDIRLRFNSGTDTDAVGFEIKRNAGESTGDVEYRNTGTGNHEFYTNGTNRLNIQNNNSVTSRGSFYVGYLDGTANDKAIQFSTESASTPTAYIRRKSGANGAFDMVNQGTGTFNLYTNDIKALRLDNAGGITTHGYLALGWNNQATAETIELSFRAEANSNSNARIKRDAGANGNFILDNYGSGYIYAKSRGKLYLESATGAIYRSGTGTHQFENGYITHQSHANWTGVSFQNSWGNFAGHQACQYYKDAMGFVHLRGLAHKAGTHAFQTAINLPAGFRPAAQEIFAAEANGGHRRIDLYANGNVVFGAGNGDHVSISGITFYAG